MIALLATSGSQEWIPMADDSQKIGDNEIEELLKQAQYQPLSVSTMAATLFAVNKGYMDDVDVKKVLAFEAGLHQFLKTMPVVGLSPQDFSGLGPAAVHIAHAEGLGAHAGAIQIRLDSLAGK